MSRDEPNPNQGIEDWLEAIYSLLDEMKDILNALIETKEEMK